MPPESECAVVFLAGGRSSRMGTPKAWLEFDRRPLLAHLVERMLDRFPEVIVVSAPGQDLPPTPARLVYDERPGEGPLAGLAVGLKCITRPLAFVASCDVPFLDPDLARYLLGLSGDYDAVVPEWSGRLHPLQAIYRTSMQPLVEQQLAAGHRRMVDLYSHARTRIVGEDELRKMDPVGLTFLNVNTPEEHARALELWTERVGQATTIHRK